MSEDPSSQRTWGGRFHTKPDELMTRINASIRFDKRLWREDIAASKAHAEMLRDQGIVGRQDAEAILQGLDRIASEVKRIPVELAEAREAIWTPEKEKPDTPTKLWTPGSKETA